MSKKDPAIDRAIGARVRLARTEKQISQGALGEQLGISFQQVQKYELGKDRVSASMLLGISNIMNKDISFFFNLNDDATEDGLTLADVMDRRGRERADSACNMKIIRLLQRVPGDVKRHTAKLLEAIAGPVETEQPTDAPAPQLQAAE